MFLGSFGIDPKRAPEAFDGLDEDKDGVISRSELVKAGVDYFQGIDEKCKSRYLYAF